MVERLVKPLLWGVGSVALYAALFTNEKVILDTTAQGRWSCIIPVAIAFAFSLVHGNFTGAFWESVGIRAKETSPNSEDPLE